VNVGFLERDQVMFRVTVCCHLRPPTSAFC
jgi:hypothetical protein